MAIIKGKNPRKPYTVRYRDSFGRQREKSFSTRREADAFQTDQDYVKRYQGADVNLKAGKENFGAACVAYIDSLQRTESTKDSYRTVLSKWVAPVVGHMTIAQAAKAHETVENLITVKMAHLSANRKQTARLLITGTLDKAVRQDKISGHKITDIETGRDVRPCHDDFVFPSFAQVSTLAAMVGIVVWLMRGCGLRIAEALAVEKSDFRNGGRTLRVSGQASRDGREKMPLKARNTGEYRDVPVPAWLWAMVKDLPDGPICPGNGRRYMLYSTVHDRFAKSVRVAGIDGRFTPHSLRHVFASVMLGEGVQITDVAKWLGHKSINVTYAIYGHLLPNADEKAIAALDREYAAWSTPRLKAA